MLPHGHQGTRGIRLRAEGTAGQAQVPPKSNRVRPAIAACCRVKSLMIFFTEDRGVNEGAISAIQLSQLTLAATEVGKDGEI